MLQVLRFFFGLLVSCLLFIQLSFSAFEDRMTCSIVGDDVSVRLGIHGVTCKERLETIDEALEKIDRSLEDLQHYVEAGQDANYRRAVVIELADKQSDLRDFALRIHRAVDRYEHKLFVLLKPFIDRIMQREKSACEGDCRMGQQVLIDDVLGSNDLGEMIDTLKRYMKEKDLHLG